MITTEWYQDFQGVPCPQCARGADGYTVESFAERPSHVLTLSPCGHMIGALEESKKFRAAFRAERERRDARQAEATMKRHQALLDKAEAAGHGILVEQYRTALFSQSRDATGLLAALTSLTAP